MAGLSSLIAKISPVRPQEVRMASKLGPLSQTLRGGTQPVEQLLKQLQGKPGVKQGALQQVFGHLDAAQRLAPQELRGQARSPRLFAQRGITTGMDDDAMHEAAWDLIHHPVFDSRREEVVRNVLRETLGTENPEVSAMLRQRVWDPATRSRAVDLIEQEVGSGVVDDAYMEALGPDALDMVTNNPAQFGGKKQFGPAWGSYQRQAPMTDLERHGAEYFETVLRGQPSRQRGDLRDFEVDHFGNPAQLGHVRGTLANHPNNADMFIEELQSDPLEALGAKHPAMEGIYGKLGRMVLDRAAEADVPRVHFPDAKRIASVRSQSQLPFFESAYDKALGKELYTPLSARGVPVQYDNGWWTMSLDDKIRDAIRQNKGILNYKRGGLAQATVRA